MSTSLPLTLGWFETARATVQEACDGKDATVLANLHATLDMSFEEHGMFQNLKSLAVQNGTMTLALGQKLFALAGTVPSVFNKRPLADKVMVTEIHKALLAGRIAERKAQR